uniref:RING-type domain-containing protein n=1 Tax=Strongyloides papillosus TaxID=174720 RepID=A0A0N5B8H6_STREA
MEFGVGSLGNGFLDDHKHFILPVFETILRLPGPLLLELWWRKKNMNFTQITEEVFDNESLQYLDSTRILEFVHSRNLDDSVAVMLSYSILFICGIILLIPLKKLFTIYTHLSSFMLFAFGYYMSSCYIEGEQNSEDDSLRLDSFVKLERHGSFIAAQVALAVFQSCLLKLTSDFEILILPIYVLPIFGRMCGVPKDSLIILHNISCCMNFLIICGFIYYIIPLLNKEIKSGLKKVRTIIIVRGIGYGAVMIFKRLRLIQLLTTSWITMLITKMVYEYYGKERSIDDLGSALIATIADCTSTPISLLSLALTVSQICKLIVHGVQYVVFNNERGIEREGHQGYTEALTLLLLCAQAGLLGMKTEQKTFMLTLVLFIVLSALFQSLYNLLEPQMLALASSRNASKFRHVKSLLFAFILAISPIIMSFTLMDILPIDLWCVIIVANCTLTSIRTISTIIIYFLTFIENKAMEPWELLDDLIFFCRTVTRFLELFLATFVVLHGIFASFYGYWSTISITIMTFHTYFNVYKNTKTGIATIKARFTAVTKIKQLPKITGKRLEECEDLCAICFMEMRREARITPCKHVFHGYCLKKWMFVKTVCPLCYNSLSSKEEAEMIEGNGNDGELQRLLIGQNTFNQNNVNIDNANLSNSERSSSFSSDDFSEDSMTDSSEVGVNLETMMLNSNVGQRMYFNATATMDDWESE